MPGIVGKAVARDHRAATRTHRGPLARTRASTGGVGEKNDGIRSATTSPSPRRGQPGTDKTEYGCPFGQLEGDQAEASVAASRETTGAGQKGFTRRRGKHRRRCQQA